MTMGGPLSRIRSFMTKANELINIQSWVVSFTDRVSTLNSKDYPTKMADIMIDAFLDILWKLTIIVYGVTEGVFSSQLLVFLFFPSINPTSLEFIG